MDRITEQRDLTQPHTREHGCGREGERMRRMKERTGVKVGTYILYKTLD